MLTVIIGVTLLNTGTHYLLCCVEKIAVRAATVWDDTLFKATRKPLTVILWVTGATYAIRIAHQHLGTPVHDFVLPARSAAMENGMDYTTVDALSRRPSSGRTAQKSPSLPVPCTSDPQPRKPLPTNRTRRSRRLLRSARTARVPAAQSSRGGNPGALPRAAPPRILARRIGLLVSLLLPPAGTLSAFLIGIIPRARARLPQFPLRSFAYPPRPARGFIVPWSS